MDLLTGHVTAQFTADHLCEVQFRSFIYTAAGLDSSNESCTSGGQANYAHCVDRIFKALRPDHPRKLNWKLSFFVDSMRAHEA